MPKSDDRFYLFETKTRPLMYGDIGSLVRVEGIVIGGAGMHSVLYLPGSLSNPDTLIELTLEEWSDLIQRFDDPEILVGPVPNGQNATVPKIFHRKLRYAISGAVQQKVWAADGFKCAYCGAKMGDVLMTIDHFRPLEFGGVNNETNYLTACKACNKAKGNQEPIAFCEERGFDYERIKKHLLERKV